MPELKGTPRNLLVHPSSFASGENGGLEEGRSLAEDRTGEGLRALDPHPELPPTHLASSPAADGAHTVPVYLPSVCLLSEFVVSNPRRPIFLWLRLPQAPQARLCIPSPALMMCAEASTLSGGFSSFPHFPCPSSGPPSWGRRADPSAWPYSSAGSGSHQLAPVCWHLQRPLKLWAFPEGLMDGAGPANKEDILCVAMKHH